MTIFRMVPWEHDACTRLPTRAERASYRQWVRRAATGIGDAHVALILQPDGPFALCAPGGSTAALAADRLRGEDLLRPGPHQRLHRRRRLGLAEGPTGGVRPVPDARGHRVRARLRPQLHPLRLHGRPDRLRHPPGRRAGRPRVRRASTSSSTPRPTASRSTSARHAARTRTTRRCARPGPRSGASRSASRPPTTWPTRRWGLRSANRARARAHVDGYLWFGRPWLYMQADPFVMTRALLLARTTPY